MKYLMLVLFIIFFYSCKNKTTPKNIKMSLPTWSFIEGTEGIIGGHKVTFDNIKIQDYTLEDGTVRKGPAGSLSLPNRKKLEMTGVGSTFALGGVIYEVTNVEVGYFNGQVTVEVYVPKWSFTEGTVGMLGGHKVMFCNFMLRYYTLADGTEREGPAASLSLPGKKEWETIGVGSTFILDSVTYELINIEIEDSDGEVTITKKE